MGSGARRDRYGPRGASRGEKGFTEGSSIVIGRDCAAYATPFADTYGMTLAYVEGHAMLDHDAMPNRYSHRTSYACRSSNGSAR